MLARFAVVLLDEEGLVTTIASIGHKALSSVIA
jgi:hypothetical protein